MNYNFCKKPPHSFFPASAKIPNRVTKSRGKDSAEISLSKHLKKTKKVFEKESEPKQNKFCKKT